MANETRWGAAAAALFFSSAAMVAQQAPAKPPSPTVESRMAAATLAESRGDFAAAQAELLAALPWASETERFAVLSKLALLGRRQGTTESDAMQDVLREAPGKTPQGDPVQRLIATLELGSPSLAEVKDAVDQLQSLGSLAVPPMLAALPKLGPFGLANGLRVLGSQADPRIAPALLVRLGDADPAIALAIADQLRGMKVSVAVPVARALAAGDASPEVLLGAFIALRRQGIADEAMRTLAVRLAKQPAVHATLVDELDDATDDVALAVQGELCRSAVGMVRAGAMARWLRAQKELTEAAALEQLARLESENQWWVARELVATRRDWVRVGLLALRHYMDGAEQLNESWFDQTEWWRLPELSAPVLLSLCERRPEVRRLTVARQMATIVERGWWAPAELQQPLEQLLLDSSGNNTSSFVKAIPATDEERALATWQRLDPGARFRFCESVVRLGRPWHRVVARQLATYESAASVHLQFVERDWSGAPADAIASLVQLVERFPRPVDGRDLEWHKAVVSAFGRHANLPAALVRPLLWRSDAWQALAKREPKEALAYARATPDFGLAFHNEINQLLLEHGSGEDVPMAVRLFASDAVTSQYVGGIEDFLRRHGRGRLEVLALGRSGVAGVGSRREVARDTAGGLRAEQVPEVLVMFGDLVAEVRNAVLTAIEPLMQRQHGPLVARAIESALANEAIENRDACLRCLARLAAATEDPQCLAALRHMLGAVDDEAGAVETASAMLAVAGAQQDEVLRELLRSTMAAVVRTAIREGDLQTSPETRRLAKEAVLRIAVGEDVYGEDLQRFGVDGALEIARALVQSAKFPEYTRNTAEEVLTVLRRGLQATAAVAELARATRHPEESVRRRAALELGNTFTQQAAPILIEMLKDESSVVRKQAQESLDQLANYLDARAKWEQRLK